MKAALRSAAALALGLFVSATAGATAMPTREDAEACAREKEIAGITLAKHHDGPSCSHFLAAYGGNAKAPEWAMNSGAEGLRDLALTLPTTSGAAVATPPDPATVQALLARLRGERDAQPLSLWERFWRWLQEQREPQRNAEAPAWLKKLTEWMSHIPPSAARITFWTLFALLVAMLVTLIVIEVRARERPRKRAATAAAAMLDTKPAAPEIPLALDDIDRLPAHARPGALLRWLLRALATRGAVPADSAMTNRELARHLPAASATHFAHFIDRVEPAVYGGATLRDDDFGAARALAAALSETASARHS